MGEDVIDRIRAGVLRLERDHATPEVVKMHPLTFNDLRATTEFARQHHCAEPPRLYGMIVVADPSIKPGKFEFEGRGIPK